MRGGYRFAILVNVALFALFAGAALMVVRIVDDHARRTALEEAKAKAHIILSRNLATHSYFAAHLKPSVFRALEAETPEGYFDPVWMSSTFAAREMVRIFTQDDNFSKYYYKEAAINARTPENEADSFEREFIRQLNGDRDLKLSSGVRIIANEPYYVVMQRGETMEEGCLMCHSVPESAPKGLLDYYGSERSFHRQAGEVVSALSIRIPLAEALRRADEISDRLKKYLMLVLGILLVAQGYITNRLRMSNEMLQRTVRDKEMLMREIHHRVKNNLTVIQSLLALRSEDLSDDRSRGYLAEAHDRVRSMAMIHERLQASGNATTIKASEYVCSLVNELFRSYRVSQEAVQLSCAIQDLELDVEQVIPMGLIINELVSNALKYAFPDGRAGELHISLRQSEASEYELVVRDTGVGLSDGFSVDTGGSFGLQIVDALVRQLSGRMEMSGTGGTTFRMTFSGS